MPRNIIITGSNGFIGSVLCGRLASDNNVIGVDKVSTPSPENFVSEQTDLTEFNGV